MWLRGCVMAQPWLDARRKEALAGRHTVRGFGSTLRERSFAIALKRRVGVVRVAVGYFTPCPRRNLPLLAAREDGAVCSLRMARPSPTRVVFLFGLVSFIK